LTGCSENTDGASALRPVVPQGEKRHQTDFHLRGLAVLIYRKDLSHEPLRYSNDPDS
jgi:hypothetical protein